MNVAVHSKRLNIISICSGGGGLDLGVELAIPGARACVYVEREAFSVATLVSAMEAGLLAPAPIWSDARTFNGRRWRGCVDGLIGGIPCQPHSVAGRKRGSRDERDLWSAARRIIVHARPWFVLIENVAGMLSAGDDEIAGAERVWRDLRKLGFKVEGGLFRASEVGAPHERERIFILGMADDARRSRRSGASAAPGSGGERPDRGGGSELANPDRQRLEREWPHTGARGRQNARGSSGLCDGANVANSDLPQLRREPPAGQQQVIQRDDAAGAVDDAPRDDGSLYAGWRSEGTRTPDARRPELGLFPPRPADINRWREILAAAPHLEPAVCGLADGLARTRIDWLRLLGNGVVPIQAALAVRTLAHRLAASGSSGATRLVLMMEDN